MKKYKVLIILTSHDQLGDTGEKTGYWKEEFASPYYTLKDAGIEVTLATPKGGKAPLDPASTADDYLTDSTRRLDQDDEALTALKNTVKLENIQHENFNAVFYPGGHGPLWDLHNDNNSIKLIESFVNAGKPVAAVCHAPVALLKVKDKNGDLLIKGKKIAGFKNSEEAAVGLTDVVPLLLEDELVNAGAIYNQGDDFSSFIVQDGLLITGQNPASSEAVAEALLGTLN